MIVVTVELWRGSDPARRRLLGRAFIANDGTGSHARGHYDATFYGRSLRGATRPTDDAKRRDLAAAYGRADVQPAILRADQFTPVRSTDARDSVPDPALRRILARLGLVEARVRRILASSAPRSTGPRSTITSWTCGCGHVNGDQFARCSWCQRRPEETR